jgi:6-phosphogluconolactonase
MVLKVYDTVDEEILSMAEYIVALANKSLANSERFSFALSGGKSAKKLYDILTNDQFRNKIDWQKIDFFLGDERYVPHTDDASNFKMAKETLLVPLHIPSSNIFPVNTSIPPDDAASDYWSTIQHYFKGEEPRFDFILLGFGDNSHTASLFPFTPVLNDTTPGVKPVWLQDQQVYRITLNAPLINLAKNIAFLVYGKEKASAVFHVIKGYRDIQRHPAQLIEPVSGEVYWFLDKEAASEI